MAPVGLVVAAAFVVVDVVAVVVVAVVVVVVVVVGHVVRVCYCHRKRLLLSRPRPLVSRAFEVACFHGIS